MGALSGFRIIEMAGLGPAPFAAMMLADHGAEVIRIERPSHARWPVDILVRSRQTLKVDLKTAEGLQVVRRLVRSADGLIEGFRPGAMERLGLGPDALLEEHPGLVYGRMTGWGQEGPYAAAPGHDLNYIALAGALAHFGRAGSPPTPPLNLVGDFGGGGMLLAFGMVAALLSASRTGRGQVVDCAMVDGAALLMAMTWSLRAMGDWSDVRGANLLDSGAPFYDVYECADGAYVSVAAIEPQFYAALLEGMDLDPTLCASQMDRARWPETRTLFASTFRTKTASQWEAILQTSDACFAPVLTMGEAATHPHNLAREVFVTRNGVVQPAPAPRFSDTPAEVAGGGDMAWADVSNLLAKAGYDDAAIQTLKAQGAVG